jgi:hypothetical protein
LTSLAVVASGTGGSARVKCPCARFGNTTGGRHRGQRSASYPRYKGGRATARQRLAANYYPAEEQCRDYGIASRVCRHSVAGTGVAAAGPHSLGAAPSTSPELGREHIPASCRGQAGDGGGSSKAGTIQKGARNQTITRRVCRYGVAAVGATTPNLHGPEPRACTGATLSHEHIVETSRN